MKTQDSSEIFPYTGHPHIALTSRQMEVIAGLKDKIDQGIYKLEGVVCICAGSGRDRVIARTDRYGLKINTVICLDCGLVRTNPRLNEESLNGFYKQEYRDLYMGPEYRGNDSYFQGMIRRGIYVLELIRRLNPGLDFKGKEVLEIGCSMGGILVPFLKSGAKVKGYDYDQRYLDYGKKRFPGLDLESGGIDKLKENPKQYDIIILNHVLEHLAQPLAAVNYLEKSLMPSGILYISVPGIRNPEYYFSATKSFIGALHVAHLYHFSPVTLRNLFKGFSPVYIDNRIEALFKSSDSSTKHSSKALRDDFKELERFIRSYELSWNWKLFRSFFRVKERYDKGLIWRMQKIKMFLTQDALRDL